MKLLWMTRTIQRLQDCKELQKNESSEEEEEEKKKKEKKK